ncbi:MAG: SUMF1/EgtB/PvdO family nonheme iron enzyme, partial [Lentisphaeria bacterium]|nr:SUMF1/EgtB/PvdO family nonheme iron enzyme [Lentisphaeria bacterium]
NVWEWCLDTDGSSRVMRGGSWYFNARLCRVAIRNDFYPDYRGCNYGFRLALVPVQ